MKINRMVNKIQENENIFFNTDDGIISSAF